MTEQELSPPDRKALAFIRDCRARHRRPPSYPEIGRHIGLTSPNNANRNVARLVRHGFLKKGEVGVRGPGRPRALEGAEPDAPRGFAVPVAGHIAAGPPTPISPSDDAYLEIERLFGGDDVRFLKVRGESMIEAAIVSGDYVAVRPCAKGDDGRLVVAEIDGEHTLKVFRALRGEFYLEPRNKKLAPIKLAPQNDPRVLGVYIGLIRFPGKSNGGGRRR